MTVRVSSVSLRCPESNLEANTSCQSHLACLSSDSGERERNPDEEDGLDTTSLNASRPEISRYNIYKRLLECLYPHIYVGFLAGFFDICVTNRNVRIEPEVRAKGW